MSEASALTWVLGILATVCTFIFGLSAYLRNRRADEKSSGERGGSLLADIEYIKKGIDEIKNRQNAQDEKYIDLVRQMATFDVKLQNEHDRITQMMCRNPEDVR